MDISGGFVPTNLFVGYRFSYARLGESLRHFYGSAALELAQDEQPGAGLELADDFTFADTEQEFEHLRVLLTYLHEQFHARHLTSSPLGLLLYLIGGRQYAYVHDSLRRWGERMAGQSAGALRMPLLVHHEGDPELEEIAAARATFGTFQALFMEELEGVTLLEAASGVLAPLCDEVALLTAAALGREDVFPDIDVSQVEDLSTTPATVTGRAAIEGLARMNEFMTLALMQPPLDLLNRYVAEKQHGAYGATIGMVGALLGLSGVDAWMVVARLSDWALQAPVLPFLLRGRASVPVLELLPAWRFFLLVSRFEAAGMSVADLQERERDVAAELFGGMGWEDPWQIGERIEREELPPPRSALTRHYVENLQLGAELRRREPHVLSWPALGDEGHRLGAVFNLFTDGFTGGSTGKLTSEPDSRVLVTSLIVDATVDALLEDADLSRALFVARHAVEFLGLADSAGTLVGTSLRQLVGANTAAQLLKTSGWLQR